MIVTIITTTTITTITWPISTTIPCPTPLCLAPATTQLYASLITNNVIVNDDIEVTSVGDDLNRQWLPDLCHNSNTIYIDKQTDRHKHRHKGHRPGLLKCEKA
ncbi:Phosphoglycerate kinase [Dirofilaria immitis]